MAIATGEKALAADIVALGQTKALAFTKDLAQASGDVAYTGFGFTPSVLFIMAYYSGYISLGSSDATKIMQVLYKADVLDADTTHLIWISDGTNAQQALIKSYDADGFTLTWTKTLNASGTANLTVFAFR